MGRRRAFVRQRAPVFFGCEGLSEVGYGRFLQILADEADLHLHIDAVDVQNGDPLAIVEGAVALARRREAARAPYRHRVLALDADQLGTSPERDARAISVADRAKFRLLWQRPCFEALLLRHLEGCETLRPALTRDAEREIAVRWPDYRKGLPALDLRRRLHIGDVLRAAGVEDDLAAILRLLGLIR